MTWLIVIVIFVLIIVFLIIPIRLLFGLVLLKLWSLFFGGD